MLKQAKAQGNEIELFLSHFVFLLFQVDSKIDFDFEECPKWNALTEVVKEIKEEVKLNEKDHPPQQILIFVSDDRVRQQLEDLLSIGKSSF